MCLPIGSCFGFGAPRTDDAPPRNKISAGNGTGTGNGGHHNYNGNGNGGHYNGNGYYYPAAHGAAAGAEAGRKASNDVRGTGTGTARHAGAAAPRGGAVEKAAYPYERAQPPAHREDAADSYYPAATATADHESPSEKLGETLGEE